MSQLGTGHRVVEEARMMDEPLSDAERVRLLRLAIEAVPRDEGDAELTRLIAVLSGVDTVLIARRAYPARAYPGWVSASNVFLSRPALLLLLKGVCPDCHRYGMVQGPKGGICTNEACPHCGIEFNVARINGDVVMAHHNPPIGSINRERLRDVFGIVLPD